VQSVTDSGSAGTASESQTAARRKILLHSRNEFTFSVCSFRRPKSIPFNLVIGYTSVASLDFCLLFTETPPRVWNYGRKSTDEFVTEEWTELQNQEFLLRLVFP